MSRYAAVHNTPTCQEVAFFYSHDVKDGTKVTLKAEMAVYPNGERPIKGHPVLCWNCGETIVPAEVVFRREDLELPRARTIISVDTPMHFGQTLLTPGEKTVRPLEEVLRELGLKLEDFDPTQQTKINENYKKLIT